MPRSSWRRPIALRSWRPRAATTTHSGPRWRRCSAHAGRADGFLEQSLGEIAAEVIDPDREALAAGRRLGQYEIVALIGAGGMGEVYRARDTKLGRDVAIKVIASAASAGADQMARFEREARILAALNHPHIGAIYGLEDVDGIRALVLELVEGKTLAERLAEAARRCLRRSRSLGTSPQRSKLRMRKV